MAGSYKFKIQEIAEMLAEDDGKDYYDLSTKEQMEYYKKAYEDYLDRDLNATGGSMKNAKTENKMMADAGMMDPTIDPKKVKQVRQMTKMGSDVSTISSITGLSEKQVKEIIQRSEKLAMGGRPGFARGMDPEDMPEQEDIPTDEYLDLLKSLGAGRDQEAGIRSLMKETASYDANEKELMRLVDEFMERGFSLQEAIEEAKRELEEKSVRRKAPSIKLAEYRPGDYDPILLEDYEKYVYDMQEQGLEPMPIGDYIRMILSEARMGVKTGGITSVM
jgi:hypothetical protein